MKKVIAILAVFLMIIVGGYAVLGYTGVVQSPLSTSPVYANAYEIDTASISSLLDDNIFSQLTLATDNLNVHIYGVNDISASSIISWYEQENAENGWSPFSQQDTWTHPSSHEYNVYTRMWNRYLKGQIVITADGSLVQRYTGFQTIIVVSSAPLSTCQQYFF